MNYDEKKFRNERTARHPQASLSSKQTPDQLKLPVSTAPVTDGCEVVHMSELLFTKFGACCIRLTDILNRHAIPFAFLKGTKDIWCRDYMPVQTPSGKLVQFRYDPSYLKDAEYADSRSDVRHVDALNNLMVEFSDINLDGGNVVMYGHKAIVTDRVFSENGINENERTAFVAKLSELLECEVIIIPAYKEIYDYTGHADGMMRWVNFDTVLVNNLELDLKYMRTNILKALATAHLDYINFPFFEYKMKEKKENAIGIYINYLQVGNLIVMPVFGVEGNKDAEALAILTETFPGKTIETIDFNDVAVEGGILNCATWTIRR